MGKTLSEDEAIRIWTIGALLVFSPSSGCKKFSDFIGRYSLQSSHDCTKTIPIIRPEQFHTALTLLKSSGKIKGIEPGQGNEFIVAVDSKRKYKYFLQNSYWRRQTLSVGSTKAKGKK